MCIRDRSEAVENALRLGVHAGVEVTRFNTGHNVDQIYCSALPVAYSTAQAHLFEPLARLILRGAYRGTLAKAAAAAAGRNQKVFLTLLGGGVFGNEQAWILDAIEYALNAYRNHPLDVAIVSHSSPNPALGPLLRRFACCLLYTSPSPRDRG